MGPKHQSDFSLLMFCQHFCWILHLIQDANKQYVQCWDMPRRAQCFSELTSSNRRKMSVSHNSQGQSIVWCGTQPIFYSIPMFGALPLWNILKMPAEAARQRTKPSKKVIAFIDFNTSLCFLLFLAHCLQASVLSVLLGTPRLLGCGFFLLTHLILNCKARWWTWNTCGLCRNAGCFPRPVDPGDAHPYQRYHPFRINQVAVESSRLNLKGRRSNDSIRSTWACSGTGALGLRVACLTSRQVEPNIETNMWTYWVVVYLANLATRTVTKQRLQITSKRQCG